MTSNTLMKAGLGAFVAFGLAAAPLALAPAQAEQGSATADPSTTAALAPTGTLPAAVTAQSHVVINEAYLNGGSAGASYKNKFVELYNPTEADISLAGWSLQYRSGTGLAAPSNVAPLAGTIKAKGFYLVNGGSNGANGRDLPATDYTGTTINPAAGAGTIILSDQAAKLPADLPTGSLVGQSGVVDVLGYGTSNTYETAAATAAGVTTSLNRTGAADTDNNAADFTRDDPTPTGTGGGDEPPPPPPDAGDKTIAEVQGTGAASPLVGSTVTTQGKVTAVYPDGGFNGYFIQTPGTGGDLDPATHKSSDGVFVYSPATVRNVKIGDHVRVFGLVSEFGSAPDANKTTEINVAAGDMTQLAEPAPEVKATVLKTLPATDAERETLEGMLVSPQGTFTITDNYSLSSYGEIGLAAGTTALVQPTAVAPYGSAAYAAEVAANAARGIKLDDGASTNFSTTGSSIPLPWLGAGTPMRVGSQGEFSSNVIMDNRNDAYKFQPLEPLTAANAAAVQPIAFGNSRAATPRDVGGNLKVASFNVQNYFPTTGDQDPACQFYADRDGNPLTVKGGCRQRGAANAENLKRQQDKIVAGINASGADVLSLEEIENSAKFDKDRDNALSILVAALNAAAPGTWDYARSPAVRPAVADEDVIRTAFIYKLAVAEPVGNSVILDDAAFTGIARQPLAQSFKLAGAPDASKVLLIVNHFKSKGSALPGDTDQGQGNSNLARTAQARALLAFSTTQQKAQGTDKVMLMGDFNAYLHEDPINVLTSAGYVDQDTKTTKHSYSYGGMVGSLDHILASPGAESLVTGVDIWNINSAESIAMGYSRYNNNVTNFYDASPFAASDHDPVVVGLKMPPAAGSTQEVNLLNINDFHGRIDSNTVKFAGTVEQLRAASGDANTAFLSAGDNIGASLFASASQNDQPTLDVLNALGLAASAVGNHEFDKGYADLDGRVRTAAKWDYLGANVYAKGTTTPVLDEYKVLNVNGVKVAVIGAITQETPALVTPSGIANLDFGDPVTAVNRVAQKITDGKLADVIVAEYHEGAGAGTPDGATLGQEIAAGGAFAEIVDKTSPSVNAIFTGHTHKQYAWDAPIPGVSADAALKTRPVLQTGSYGEFIGQVRLSVDATTHQVKSYTQRNVARTTADDAALVGAYPRVAAVKAITDKALADAKVAGSVPVGRIAADITTARTFNAETGQYVRDDRASESTLGNLVGNALLDALKPAQTGGAEIGVVNPGGLRADLLYRNAGIPDGVVSYANANAVLPFVNNLWTTTLTGAQVKTMLEQQWQTNADGSIPSRPFLNLGLSSNMSYTYDATRKLGDHITSVTINGAPLDMSRGYRVGTFSFLATGGDNFRVFTEGTRTKDSGLIDRDAWIKYLGEQSAKAPIAPDFARRGVEVEGNPATVDAKGAVSFQVNKLDLTSLGSPKNTAVKVEFTDSKGKRTVVDTAGVTNGSAKVAFKMPADARTSGTIAITAAPSGTTVELPVRIINPNEQCKPNPGKKACV
ncbi:ExeM/NucH family extracellular endonuclease [Arthrobacter dokdonensis]|uniref:ExeM/NucH family extracellular endonuclease n=1 Tax=Arthrobacter dokdonellae TaxID=2211210 RepID=UPI001D132376|nr:ExeM/NucH family extracellular endonuclease [Arthrobacter dokdonellae]